MIINPFVLESGGVLPPGLIAYYKANNNANDEGGNYNASEGAGTAYAAGFEGQAFSFTTDNSNQRVLLPTINLGATYRIEFYLWAPAGLGANVRDIFSNNYQSSTNYGGLFLNGSSRRVEYWRDDAKLIETIEIIPEEVWTKVIFQYSSNKASLAIGNTFQSEEAGTHVSTYNNPAGVGWPAVSVINTLLRGRVDELKLYNTVIAIHPGQIAQFDGEDNVNDSIGHYDGTAGPDLGYVTGTPSGKAFDFTGVDTSYFQIPSIGMGSDYTIEFQLNPDSITPTFQHVISNRFNPSPGNDFGALYYTSGNLEYWHGSLRVTSGAVPINTWTKVKLTFDSTDNKSRIYLNDVLSATESTTHNENTGINLTVGNANDLVESNPFNGQMDTLKIWNEVV